MLQKEKFLYSFWLKVYRKIAKPERFGIGERIDALFLDLLDLTHYSRYASGNEKLLYLNKAIGKIDKMKFYAEIAWENKLMSAGEYGELFSRLEEVGRELWGWKKSLNKNSHP